VQLRRETEINIGSRNPCLVHQGKKFLGEYGAGTAEMGEGGGGTSGCIHKDNGEIKILSAST